jgi:gliding motility-associated-like protein
MQKLFVLQLLILFVLPSNTNAQIINFLGGPVKYISCDSNCTTVRTNFNKQYLTTSYTVDTIPFSTQSIAGAPLLSLSDDSFSTVLPIGFNFCFYGNTYSNLIVSRNGVVSFDVNYANLPCSFNTGQTIPFSSNTFPNNSICCPFIDLTTTTTGNISFTTIGQAPFRKFILQYNNLPLFGAACINAKNTFALVLHESTNWIDVNITQKSVCNTNPLDPINFATIGIQGVNTALTVPGKHANVWTATNQAWRFTPAGAPNYTVSYLPNSAYTVMQSNADSIRICTNNFPVKIVVQCNLICPMVTITDTIRIDHIAALIDSTVSVNSICKYNNNGSIHVYTSTLATPVLYFINNQLPQANPVFTNLTNGSYTVGIVDANNCTATLPAAVGSYSGLTVLIDSFKIADCTVANGIIYTSSQYGAPPVTYLWSTGATTPTLYNAYGDSTYTILVTDSLGCKDSLDVIVAKKGPIIIDSVINTTCPDSNGKIFVSVVDSSGIPPFTYLWNTGATTSFITNCAPNTYYMVKVTDSLGCYKIKNILVQQDSIPIVTINLISKPTCDKPNGVVSATVQGGTAPYTYIWNNGVTSVINNTADSGYVIVAITDFKGCVATGFTQIVDTLETNLNISKNNTTCSFNNGNATIAAWNGMAPYAYSWSNGSTANSLGNLAPGNYIVTVTDALACVKTALFNIAPSMPMTITLNKQNMNCDTTNGSISTAVANANLPVTYSWTNAASTPNVSGLSTGVYQVVATDVKGCLATAAATITDDGAPYAGFSFYKAPLCAGDSTGKITLVGQGGVAPYKYSLDGTNFVTSPTINNISAGNYTLYVKDANSCIRDTVVTLQDAPPLIIQYNTPDTLQCYYDKIDNIVFNTSGGYKPYSLNIDNGIFGGTLVASNLAIGTHTIAIKDSVGCIKYIPITIIGPDSALKVTAQTKYLQCYEKLSGATRATITGGWLPYTYSWANGSTDLLQDSLPPGKYSFSVQDARGCSITQLYLVKQLQCCEVILPNAFNPASTIPANQLFKIVLPNAITEVQFDIYNRWGQRLFSTTDATLGWDGTLQGKPLPMETYFYTIRYKCVSEENYLFTKGEFLLMR